MFVTSVAGLTSQHSEIVRQVISLPYYLFFSSRSPAFTQCSWFHACKHKDGKRWQDDTTLSCSQACSLSVSFLLIQKAVYLSAAEAPLKMYHTFSPTSLLHLQSLSGPQAEAVF